MLFRHGPRPISSLISCVPASFTLLFPAQRLLVRHVPSVHKRVMFNKSNRGATPRQGTNFRKFKSLWSLRMASVLYVYGTLRRNKETIEIPGASLYDLGWYPGLKFGGAGSVVCERIEIPSEDHYDRYEGYNPDDLDRSLYIRKPFFDGFIYEYNREPPLGSKIESGDWLEYIKTRRGGNG